ncbi:MAG TPA: hydrogenase maturation nickel metallochaperone HypA [Chloroflexota bacterium]|nr:hydrogenase maturation nickel metallochaperone HypA [Chloroflexota bacterium]
MHEMALAEGVLAVVLDAADGEPVRRVRLRVGALQAVVPDSLQFCFQLAAEGTAAADAVLELTDVPARVVCRGCGAESELRAPPFLCRQCGAADVALVAGDELLVDAVELPSGWRYRPGAEGDAPVAVEVPASHLAEHAHEAAPLPGAAAPPWAG